MSKVLFTNCHIVDATSVNVRKNMNLLVQDDVIAVISPEPIQQEGAQIIDVCGRFLMPGLIDNHVHVTAAKFDLANEWIPDSHISVQAAKFMENMLQRGFTSIRDTGGADFGLADAVDSGLIIGPRLFFGGKALSQTGGHGDFRQANIGGRDLCGCACSGSSVSRIADGVTEIRKAVREEIRRGAHHIKIMVSGGAVSPTDRISNLQYSFEEISAAVEEARNAGIYVLAHCYTAEGISRCVALGVRTIEHGNLLNHEAAQNMAKYGAYLVPTLVIYDSLYLQGKENGISADSLSKVEQVRSAGLQSIRIARANRVKVGFGTDLLGMVGHTWQCKEFSIRAQIETPLEILGSATLVNAEILNQEDKLGVVAEGAYADLLVVTHNPLEDITVLSDPAAHLDLVMKAGVIYKNRLAG